MSLSSAAFRQTSSRTHERISVVPAILINKGYIAVDLSEGGMQLRSEAPIRAGESIDLTMDLDGTNLTIQSEVRWCQKSTSIFNTDYAIGVEFINHKVSQQLELRRYIAKKMAEQLAIKDRPSVRQNSLRRHHRAIAPKNILTSNNYRPVDISESGICLQSRDATRTGKTLELALTIDSTKLLLRGVVRWCRESPSVHDSDYLCGIEFTDLRTSQQLILRQYIEHLNKK